MMHSIPVATIHRSRNTGGGPPSQRSATGSQSQKQHPAALHTNGPVTRQMTQRVTQSEHQILRKDFPVSQLDGTSDRSWDRNEQYQAALGRQPVHPACPRNRARSGTLPHLLIAGLSLQRSCQPTTPALISARIPGSARTRHRFGDEVGAAVTSSRHAETAASPSGGMQG